MGRVMKRVIFSGLFLLVLSAPSYAATCAVTSLQVKDNAGTVVTVPYTDSGDGSGNCIPNVKDPAVLAAVQASIPPQTAPYTIIGGVINGADTYNTIAASQTTQALTGGSGGATGDYLSHCVILPTTTAAGTVIIYDNSTAIFTFTTGTLSNLVPFTIPVGAVSVSGAWKVTTGANETADLCREVPLTCGSFLSSSRRGLRYAAASSLRSKCCRVFRRGHSAIRLRLIPPLAAAPRRSIRRTTGPILFYRAAI